MIWAWRRLGAKCVLGSVFWWMKHAPVCGSFGSPDCFQHCGGWIPILTRGPHAVATVCSGSFLLLALVSVCVSLSSPSSSFFSPTSLLLFLQTRYLFNIHLGFFFLYRSLFLLNILFWPSSYDFSGGDFEHRLKALPFFAAQHGLSLHCHHKGKRNGSNGCSTGCIIGKGESISTVAGRHAMKHLSSATTSGQLWLHLKRKDFQSIDSFMLSQDALCLNCILLSSVLCMCLRMGVRVCVCMLSYGCRSWVKVCSSGCSGCSKARWKTCLSASAPWLSPFSTKLFCNIWCRMMTANCGNSVLCVLLFDVENLSPSSVLFHSSGLLFV